MPQLSEDLLASLVAALDGDDVTGIVLGGSYARDDAGPFSDVDLAPFVREGRPVPTKRFFYRDGLLISVSPKTAASWRDGMRRPDTAIYLVPSLRDARILLDKDGDVAALQRDALAFQWQTLQAAADRLAATIMLQAVEDVLKSCAALAAPDELALARALQGLLSGLPLAVAMHRGVLVVSANTYFRQLEQAVGLASPWTRHLRQALGAAPCPDETPQRSPLEARGVAALHLYAATAAMLRPVIPPEDAAVIEEALRIIRAAYPQPPDDGAQKPVASHTNCKDEKGRTG